MSKETRKCKIVRAKVKSQPEVSGKFWLVKRGKTILFSAKNKKDAESKKRIAIKKGYCVK